jgi:ligand-binding sensor domain-containing protein
VKSRIYANSYYLSASPRSWDREGWMQAGEGWEAISPPAAGSAPRYILSEGGEALQVSHLEGKTLFEFLKAGEKLAVDLPVPECVGEAAWDATRLWVPGFLGLYQVERATGKVTWLAHQEQTQCTAVLKHAGKLYVATTRGLYACDIPQ